MTKTNIKFMILAEMKSPQVFRFSDAWESPGSPVAKASGSHCLGGLGSIPGQGTSSHMPQLKRSHTTKEILAATKPQLSQINIYIFKLSKLN